MSAPRSTPGARFGSVALVVVGVVALVVHLRIGDGGLGDVAYYGALVGAAVVALLGARTAGQPRYSMLIGLGVACSALGDLYWEGLTWTGRDTVNVSLADLGWVLSYVFIGIAVSELRRGPGGRVDRALALDGVAVAVVALFLQWRLSIGAVLSDSTVSVPVRLVWALYPTLDAVLLALIVVAVVSRRARGTGAIFLGLGVVCWLASDFGYTVLSGSSNVVVNAGWMAGSMLMAAAARHPAVAPAGDPDDEPSLIGYGRLAVLLGALLMPTGIDMVSTFGGHPLNRVAVFSTSVVLVGLVFLRGAGLMRAEVAARRRLRAQEGFSDTVALYSSDATLVLDADGRIIRDAPRLLTLLGRDYTDLRGVSLSQLGAMDPEGSYEALTAVFARCLEAPGTLFETELSLPHQDGRRLWVAIRIVGLLDDAMVRGVLLNLHDITDRRAAEAELERRAFHDELTGLANRAVFSDRLGQALRRSVRTRLEPVVVYLDLDGFKNVNDSLGHSAGDSLLREVAERLGSAVRDGDTVARLGGDEFAVLIEQSHLPVHEAEALADRCLQALSTPFDLGGQAIHISASIGIAVGDDEATVESLLRDADVAMYQAKAGGRGRWVHHVPHMRTAAVERLRLGADLQQALEARQLRLVYQPVVELQTDRIVGFEALLRWDHPTLGSVPPDRFIPFAEENGTIIPIGRWVLDEACRVAARWQEDHPSQRHLTMAVNLSARQLTSATLVTDVADALAASGLDPASLVLEVTETTLVEDAGSAAIRMRELRALGLRVAVDDFGTGYSSLSYLQRFPIDILKIDRSFVTEITDGPIPPIVTGLLDLSRTLQLQVVAEGVEQTVQRDHLSAQGCALAQGFLFSAPLEPGAADALLAQQDPAPVPSAATPD